MFVKGQVVKISGDKPLFIEIATGPFKLSEHDGRMYYQGWRLVGKDDPYGEPIKVTVVAHHLEAADNMDVLAHVQFPMVASACD